MAVIVRSRCKLMRRSGHDLGLIGYRDFSSKCKHDMTPGQFAAKHRSLPPYASQLRAKMSMQHMYGMRERQFRRFYESASRRRGSTAEHLAQSLERRLDSFVYRLGFACTRAEARQLVSHKSVSVNGRIVNIPSYQLQVGDEVSIAPHAREQLRIKAALEQASSRPQPDWFEVRAAERSGTLKHLPNLEELAYPFSVQMIIEFYSK